MPTSARPPVGADAHIGLLKNYNEFAQMCTKELRITAGR